MHRLLPLLLLASSLLACGGELAITVDSLRGAITDGTPTSGYPTVGELSSGCTATLVGQKTVLTAAHCANTGGSYMFTLSSGTYSGKGVRHPSYSGFNMSSDIALVLLNQAPPLNPSAIANAAPAVGDVVTLVGFGVTSENGSDSGTKREAKNKIAQLSAKEMTFYGSGNGTGNTCYGDSGGPAFASINGNFVVVGVTSRGSYCGVDGIDTRVDAFKDWVVQASGGDVVQAGAVPPKPADSEPPKVRILSPAANASVAAGQVTIKVEASDNEGVVKVELALGASVVGSLTAPPYEWTTQIAPGQHTAHVRAQDAAGNTGQASVAFTVTDPNTTPPPSTAPGPTTPTPPTPGTFGATCAGAADCASGLCAEDPLSGPGKYCTQVCTPGDASCPGGAVCERTNDPALNVCGPPAAGSGPSLGPSDGGELLGGCSLGGRPAPTGVPGLLVLLLLLARGRRRR